MKNEFKYTFDNKRYQTYNFYLKSKFHSKVFKVGLNAGFTCPNRDGSKGKDGCVFCSDFGAGEYAGDIEKELLHQFEEVKTLRHVKWPEAKYVGYFQAFSNTYAEVEHLKKLYEPILKQDNVVGLNISTRPDCFNEEIYDYLEDLSQRTDLWVELGLQSSNENTLRNINRGHTFKEYKEAIKELRSRNIQVCVHIINGLFGESKEDMIQTVLDIRDDIQAIKIHMLHVMKDTDLANIYQKNNPHILTKEQYIDIVVDQLELLPEEVVIMRLTGDAPKDQLITPEWTLKKVIVLNDIDKEMVKRDTYQGRKVNA